MKIIVGQHKIEIAKEPVNEREIDISKCEFEFDEAITSEYVKEAYFTLEGNTYKQIILNDECDIPSEVLVKKGTVEIGVVAFLVENEEEIKRYNPSPAYFNTWVGSLKDNAENSEPITPSEMEQYEQTLQNGLAEVNGKLDEIDQAIEEASQAVEDAEQAAESANNLNIDVNKVEKTTQVDLTKKDGTTKTVYINDGTSLQFMWRGTSLGIKTDDMEQYVFVDLQGIQGQPGPQGEPFRIKKTYTSVAEMNADFDNMNVGDYVMIASTVEIEDNAKLYVKGDSQWIFITDFSGATGIKGETGATPVIRIGTVTSGSTPSVTISGTAEEPVFNFVLQPGEKGSKGDTGATGPTGNGIASIAKTSSAGLIDTYTITFTNGSTTTFNVTNGQDGEVTQEYVDEENERLKSVFNVLPKVSDSGESIELENTGDTMLYKMDLKGNTSQEVIQGEVGLEEEDTSIYVDDVNEDKENYVTLKGNTYQETTTGKNLLNKNLIENGKVTNNYGSPGATPSPSGSTDRATLTPTNAIKVNPSTTYTFNYTDSNFNFALAQMTSDKISIGDTGWKAQSTTPFSITTAANCEYIGFNFRKRNSTTITNSEFNTFINSNIQLEEGSSATSYEEYTGGKVSPNPDYPQDVEVVTGENVVKVEGKNLLNTSANNTTLNVYFNSANGLITNDNTKKNCIFNEYILVKPNTTYTISSKEITNHSIYSCVEYDSDKNFIRYISSGEGRSDRKYTFTTGSTTSYIRIRYKYDNVSDITNEIIESKELQLEVGSQATTYEPYKEQTYEVNLGSIELCKIGTYQDRIYKSNGNWYLHKEIGKVVLDGSVSGWIYDTEYKYFRNPSYNFGNNIPLEMNSANKNTYMQYMNLFKINKNWSGTNSFRDNVSVQGEFYPSQNIGYKIEFRNLNIDNVTDLQAWLSTHNVINYYPLATPTETQITDTTLVNQLNALYNATIYSTTHINTETSNLLPYIDLKYNVVTASPSPDKASEVKVVTGNNTITISNEDGTKTQTYNLTLGNLELCKIGDYQDYFYKDNGNWYKYGAIGKVVLNGSESWKINGTGTSNYFYYITGMPDANNTDSVKELMKCNRYIYATIFGTNTNQGIWYSTSYLRIRYGNEDTVANFKTWLSNNNVEVYYVLATPTTTQITDQLLVSQLDELQKAMSYYDKTLITQVNASKPFILDVVAIRDLQDIFNL